MKKGPVIFILILSVVLFYVLGFRSGQKVEKSNEKTDFYLSIPPSPSMKPQLSPTPVKYTEYKSKRWGIRFNYPENLEILEDASRSAVFFKAK